MPVIRGQSASTRKRGPGSGGWGGGGEELHAGLHLDQTHLALGCHWNVI